MKKQKALIQLILAMSIFGTLGLLRRCLPLPSGLLALCRGALGSLFLLAVQLIRKKKPAWAEIRENRVRLLASGAALGIDWILLFEAYRYTTVATATLCYYMAPVLVILISPLVLKEKITWKKGICAAVSTAGMVLASGVLQTGFSGAGECKGIGIGFLAAVLYASYILINRKLVSVPSFDRAIIQLGTAAVVLLPYNLLTVDWGSVTLDIDMGLLIIIAGIVHTGIAYGLYLDAMSFLPSQTIALMSYVDPMVAVCVSAVVLRETKDAFTVIGAVLLLGSMFAGELTAVPFRNLPKKRFPYGASVTGAQNR